MTSTSHTPGLGELREIDGRRLFAHQVGSGAPPVVFLPGAGAVGVDYLGVAERTSRFTTSVLYDRGGTGFSDPLDLPRSATVVVTELHTLLRSLGLPAPYVLAAHSLGGFYAHRFAQLYPSQVAGLVWLDAFGRDWDDVMPLGARLSEVERMAPSLEQMRPAVREVAEETWIDQPEHVRRTLVQARSGDAWIRAGVTERTGLADLAAELRDGPPVPDVPTVAITATSGDPASETIDRGKARLHAALVDATSSGRHDVLTGVEHHRLCLDRPDAVATAIREVVERARP